MIGLQTAEINSYTFGCRVASCCFKHLCLRPHRKHILCFFLSEVTSVVEHVRGAGQGPGLASRLRNRRPRKGVLQALGSSLQRPLSLDEAAAFPPLA